MSKDLAFVTTNLSKFQDVKKYLNNLNSQINLKQENIELLEPQSLDVEEIAIFKAKYAWNILQKPLIVDDGGIFIEKYNKFPGALSKWVFKAIGLEGVWLLAKDDPKAYFMSIIVYIDGPESFKVFSGTTNGKIIKPGNIIDTIMPYTHIFIPDGANQTYADLKNSFDQNKYNHRYKAISKFVDWCNNLI